MNNQQLDDLLRLNADVIPLASFDANPSSGKKKVENKLSPKKGLKERKKTTDTPKHYSSTAVDVVINVDTDSHEPRWRVHNRDRRRIFVNPNRAVT